MCCASFSNCTTPLSPWAIKIGGVSAPALIGTKCGDDVTVDIGVWPMLAGNRPACTGHFGHRTQGPIRQPRKPPDSACVCPTGPEHLEGLGYIGSGLRHEDRRKIVSRQAKPLTRLFS